ncbi:MAG: FkbM family methyltransferase [Rhodomicrobium sp.]
MVGSISVRSALKSLVCGTALEKPLRQAYLRLKNNEHGLREERDNAFVHLLLATLKSNSNCIDIGAHSGFFLEQFLEAAPEGHHFAFEPIATLAAELRQKFPGVSVYDCALSDHDGRASFQYVPELPAWSGLELQPYPEKATPQAIEVDVRKLDSMLPPEMPVHFIKIDVEGAELAVLNGARETLRRWKPLVYFECGKVHHIHYGTEPRDIFDLFEVCGMGVHLLDLTPLTKEMFLKEYESAYKSGYNRFAWGNFFALAAPAPEVKGQS